MNQTTTATESLVQMAVPESAVPHVQDFLEKRSAGRPVGLCLGVPLPDFDGVEHYALYDIKSRKWVVCAAKEG